jgi:MFS family permease
VIIAFVVAMSLPFGLVIVAVYLPVVVAMRQASMVGLPTGLFALAGVVAAPVAGLLLLVLGHALFRGQRNVPDSLWQDLSRLFGQQFVLLIPSLVALMIGGAVFGAGFAQGCRYLERAFPEAEGLRNQASGPRGVTPDSY